MHFHQPEDQIFRFRRRLAVAVGFVVVCFSVLFARFFWLQVVQQSYYQTRAEENRIALLPIVPNRGLIVDRNGEVLSNNYSAYTLEITPSKVPNLEATIDELAKEVSIEAKDRKRFKRLMEENKNFDSLAIRNRLSDEEVARFIARRYRFPGVEIKARLFRNYPQGALASHLVGYISRINDRDQEKIEDDDQEDNYEGTEYFGKTGLEQKYEYALHGETGFEQVEVDSGGRAVRALSRIPPVPGANLHLTVDLKLQEIAEKAFGDNKGALVAIEPSTGGILALVSMPGFDPSLFVDGIDPQNWRDLNESPDRPMVNRAINGAYPPGSTFKPYMALAALELGKRSPSQTISDPGFFDFGGHKFRDDKPGGHGTVDMYKSIVVSCDTYYYRLANDLGIENIAGFMAPFGFGSPTGVDIEGEGRGILPSAEWKMKRFKQKWYPGETVSIGIGQGYNAYTPIQIAQAVATLANNGVMFRPHIVNYIENSKTGARTYMEPKPVRTIALKPENLEFIKHAMEGVNQEGGTGGQVFKGAGYTSAGKTGTAQVIGIKANEKYSAAHTAKEHRDHGLFIAFAPVDKPRIAVAALVENGGFGAQSAAPIVRQVLDYYLLGKVPGAPAVLPAKPAAPAPGDDDQESD
ncbi:MAG: penicillin-binding protein 2 [Rhodocyclaceae bacterium]|nr:penicillin-binding protein 2 [Rhodocyclaceae bacterium]